MPLGNMRERGVNHLIAYCLNDTRRHQAVIDVLGDPDDFQRFLFFLYIVERGRFSIACDRRHIRIKTYTVMNRLPRCLAQMDVDLCQQLRTALPLRLAWPRRN
jgi:hypothetical protein